MGGRRGRGSCERAREIKQSTRQALALMNLMTPTRDRFPRRTRAFSMRVGDQSAKKFIYIKSTLIVRSHRTDLRALDVRFQHPER